MVSSLTVLYDSGTTLPGRSTLDFVDRSTSVPVFYGRGWVSSLFSSLPDWRGKESTRLEDGLDLFVGTVPLDPLCRTSSFCPLPRFSVPVTGWLPGDLFVCGHQVHGERQEESQNIASQHRKESKVGRSDFSNRGAPSEDTGRIPELIKMLRGL